MDKKKIIALLLFLLMGFTMFAFANPSQEDFKDNQDQIKNVEDTDNTVDEDSTTVTPVITPKKYTVAKPTVKTTNEDVVVDLSADKKAAKDALKKYRDELAISDSTKADDVVSNGNKNIDNATTTDEIKKALDDAKKELDKLVNPIISNYLTSFDGSNGNYTNDKVVTSWDITDNGTITNVEYSYDQKTWRNMSKSEWYGMTRDSSRSGSVYVRATDNDGNLSNVIDVVFNIDKTSPVFTNVNTSHSKTTIKLNVTDTYSGIDKIEVRNQDNGKIFTVKNGYELTDEATYFVTAYDKVGNKSSIWLAIDKTAPVITVEGNKLTVSDKFLHKGSLTINGTKIDSSLMTVGNKNEDATYTATMQDGSYTVVATDKVGNTTTKTFTVDTTAPTLTLNGEANVELEVGKDTYTEENATATDNIDGTWTVTPEFIHYSLNGPFIETVDKVDTNKVGTYKIVYSCTDKAGNKCVDANRSIHNYVMRTVTVVDKTAPVITVKKESKGSIETATFTSVSFKLYDNVAVAKTYLNGELYQTLSLNKWSDTNGITVTSKNAKIGKNIFEVEDVSGNKTSYEFTLEQDINYSVAFKYFRDKRNPWSYGVATKEYGVDFALNITDNNGNNVSGTNISNIKVYGYDKDGNELVSIWGRESLTAGLAGGSILNSNVCGSTCTISGYANIPEVTKKSSSWDNTWSTQKGYVTFTKAKAVIELVNGKTITKEIDITDEISMQKDPVTIFIYSDNEAPVITLNGNSEVTLNQYETYTDAGATATDNYDGNVNVTTSNDVNTAVAGNYTVTYTATDKAGNTAIKTRLVTVKEVVDYSVNLDLFQDYRKNGGYEGYYFELSFINNKNTFVDSSKVTDIQIFAYDATNTQLVKIYATDKLKTNLAAGTGFNGNIISGYADIDGVEKQSTSWGRDFADIDGYVTAKKAVVTATLITGETITDTIDIDVTRFIKFDKTAPVITLNGNSEVNVELGSKYTELGATATDVYDGNVAVTTSGTVDASKVGTYTVTYTATDKAGNIGTATRTVKVSDTTAPTITLNGKAREDFDKNVFSNKKYTDKGVKVSDLSNYSLKETITFTKPYASTSETVSSVNLKEVGTYVITYTATDIYGNAASVTRTVVVDQLINSEADILITPYIDGDVYLITNYIEVGSTMPTFSAKVEDIFNNKIFNWTDEDTSKYLTIDTSSVNMSKVGIYTIKFTATDWAGNKKTITRDLHVVDYTKPVITFNGTKTVKVNGYDVVIPDYTATDNYDGNVTSKVTYKVNTDYEITGKLFNHYKQQYATSVTYTVTDNNHNTTEITKDITKTYVSKKTGLLD